MPGPGTSDGAPPEPQEGWPRLRRRRRRTRITGRCSAVSAAQSHPPCGSPAHAENQQAPAAPVPSRASGGAAEILQAYSRYGYTLAATRRALEAAMAGGRQAEQRVNLKQRSLLVRFGRRGIEQLVADHLDRGLTYTKVVKKYGVALSTVGKYIQQAKRERAEALT